MTLLSNYTYITKPKISKAIGEEDINPTLALSLFPIYRKLATWPRTNKLKYWWHEDELVCSQGPAN